MSISTSQRDQAWDIIPVLKANEIQINVVLVVKLNLKRSRVISAWL